MAKQNNYSSTLLKCFACIILCNCFLVCKAQFFALDNGKKQAKIHFRMLRNMIVVPLTINHKGPFNFIIDTGVGIMVITDPQLVDSINIDNKRTINLYGTDGGKSFEAYGTSALDISMPGLHSFGVAAAIFKEDHFGLSNYAGIAIHGLLGYDLFSQLAVKINFSDSTLVFANPGQIRPFKKGIKIPISIEDRKPYLTTCLLLADGKTIKSKLVVDLGAGHSILLENGRSDSCYFRQSIPANLGIGLTGPITGSISRINEIELGKYTLKNVLTSIPDSAVNFPFMVRRDGNIGIGVLKKFTLIFDYQNSALYLKPNYHFRESFEHDMSGLEYYAAGADFKHVIISRVEPGSAGDDVGLTQNDEIVAINLKPVTQMNMADIDNLFKSKNERNLLLEIRRANKVETVILTLKRRI